MWIEMKRTRNFTPREERRITVRYLAGNRYLVKRHWGEEMVADGDARAVETPSKRELTAAQIKALDHDNNGAAGGSLPKAQRAPKA